MKEDKERKTKEGRKTGRKRPLSWRIRGEGRKENNERKEGRKTKERKGRKRKLKIINPVSPLPSFLPSFIP